MYKYQTCIGAAEAGDIDELKRMHLANYDWDKFTPAYAAKNGHLNCLQYCFENRCEWDKYTTVYASEYGQLECLKYAIINGCEFSKESISYISATNGHLDCFIYSMIFWNNIQDLFDTIFTKHNYLVTLFNTSYY